MSFISHTRKLCLETLENRELLAVTSGGEVDLILPEPAGGNIFIVNTAADLQSWTSADDIVSLREAVSRAESGDVITFSDTLAGAVITLSGSEIVITQGITIDASDMEITINANSRSRIFNISGGNKTNPVELIGLDLTGGSNSSAADFGGAVYITGTAVITSCAIYGNQTVLSGDNSSSYGGAIYNNGTLTLLETTISHNSAVTSGSDTGSYGGAVYNTGNLIIDQCTFTENEAKNSNPAISLVYYNNCYSSGGAIYNAETGILKVSNTVITENGAKISANAKQDETVYDAGYGGGIFNAGEASVTYTTISGNLGTHGGGIYNTGAFSLNNSAVSNNRAYLKQCAGPSSTRVYGGGIYNSGNVTMTNSLIAGNTAEGISCSLNESSCAYAYGGGIYNISGNITALNSTIAGNITSASSSGGAAFHYGGGIFFDGGTSDFYNSIIAENSSKRGSDIYSNTGSSLYARNTLSAFTGWKEKTDCLLYDEALPLFENAATGNYRLAQNSQAINEGNNIYIPDTEDIEGNRRISKNIVDLGAYEYQFKDIDGITLLGWVGEEDGNPHTVTLIDPEEMTDTIRYEYNGTTYRTPPEFTEPGRYTITVTVTRTGYEKWTDSADVVIFETPSVTVTVLEDIVDPADGLISLREAISYAETGDTVTFAPELRNSTILLSGSELTVDKGITIDASGVGGIEINACGESRVFYLTGGTEKTPIVLKKLMITGGYIQGANGAGIYIDNSVTEIEESIVAFNDADTQSYSSGGGICNTGDLTIISSGIFSNTGTNGGGIYSLSGSLTISDTVIKNNYAEESGGGIYHAGRDFILTNTLAAENTAEWGGGIYIGDTGIGSTAALYNTTVANNTAFEAGGGISADSALFLYNSIAAANNASVLLTNDIDITSRITIESYYSLSSFTGWTSSENSFEYDPDALLFNDPEIGDYTLNSGSAMIDKGENSYVFTALDLAGNQRIINGIVDLGAYESSGYIPPYQITVSVVFSDTEPLSAYSADLPDSLEKTSLGTTVYAEVWLKNTDGSLLGCDGGYIDILYDPDILEYEEYIPSLPFTAEAKYASAVTEGIVEMFGGCNSLGIKDLGVDQWVLLGYASFTVIGSGKTEVSTSVPTQEGLPNEYMNLTRESVGLIASDKIDYQSRTIWVADDLDTPNIITGSDGYLPSYGANRQQITWTPVPGAQSYELAYSSDLKTWKTISVQDTSAVITGLTYGETEYYRVRAAAASAISDWSSIKSFAVCPADIDNDGFIGPGDTAILSSAWFASPESQNWHPYCNIDGDDFIGPGDRSFISSNWFNRVGEDEFTYPKPLDAGDFFFNELGEEEFEEEIGFWG